uniref:Zinc finger CCCH domain-containing protein 14 n=1 Tax=Leptobrachium leishanense TaxID=445787 RepID=A0A8C5R944_9ANUR
MVMVANKKSLDQMTDDLSLFLGNNTARFTTWLQGVLEKLRALTPGNNNLKTSEAIIFESAMPPLKSFSQSREDGIRAYVASSTRIDSKLPSDNVSPVRLTSAVKPLRDFTQSEAVIDIKLDADDSFNEDVAFSTESELYSRPRPAAEPVYRPPRPTAALYKPPGSSQPVHLTNESSIARYSRYSQNIQSTGRPIEVHTSRPNSPLRPPRDLGYMSELLRSDLRASAKVSSEEEIARKRKVPIASSVVKVKKLAIEGDEDQEGDEEEDDYMAHAGISSRVSVPARPERRPTLPPSKQANKNLILKAISEAQESVTKTTNYSTAVPEKQTVPVAPRTRMPPEEHLLLMKSRSSMVHYQTAVEETPAQITETRQETEHWRDLLSRFQPEPEAETLLVEPAVPVEPAAYRPTDSRSFILKKAKLAKDPATENQIQPGRLIQPREAPACEKPASPKFIVTLDGVPSPPGYAVGVEQELEPEPMVVEEEWESYPKSYNVLAKPDQKYPMQLVTDTPAADMLMEERLSSQQKIKERCRYWPACKNADSCPYHHPTAPCKAFPKCRFADKCFFIHPNCKYDAKCTKADCPYTHASRRLPQPKKPGTQTGALCRFFPVCKNTECTFYHPKVCRFSNSCTRPDCKFYHPSVTVPPRHALTWTRLQASD